MATRQSHKAGEFAIQAVNLLDRNDLTPAGDKFSSFSSVDMSRYLKTFLAVCVTPLLALAAFNFLVDPYNIYGVIKSPALDAAKLECGFLISRVAKAEMLRNHRCQVLVL